MGRGSKRRESQITSEELKQRWNKCFGGLVNKLPDFPLRDKFILDVELDKQNERINRNKSK